MHVDICVCIHECLCMYCIQLCRKTFQIHHVHIRPMDEWEEADRVLCGRTSQERCQECRGWRWVLRKGRQATVGKRRSRVTQWLHGQTT